MAEMSPEWQRARAKFIRHNQSAMEKDRVEGWAVAIVGIERSSYVDRHGGIPTYDENEARIFFDRQEAISTCAGLDKMGLFRFSQVVAVDGSLKFLKGGKLPTVNGY